MARVNSLQGKCLWPFLVLAMVCMIVPARGTEIEEEVLRQSAGVGGENTPPSTEDGESVEAHTTNREAADGEYDEEEEEGDFTLGDDVDDEDEFEEDDLWLFQYDPIEVGHVQDVEVEDGMTLKMKTLAINPPIFEIKDFLSHGECDYLINLASKRGLQSSQTIPESVVLSEEERESTTQFFRELDKNEDGFLDPTELLDAVSLFPAATTIELTPDHLKELIELKLDTNADGVVDIEEFLISDTPEMEEEISKWVLSIGGLAEEDAIRAQARVSDQAWLNQWITDDEVLLRLQGRVIDLTWLPGSIVQTSEHLQVVRYHPGGHYHAHYDSAELDDALECAHTYGIEASNNGGSTHDGNDFSDKRLCRLATVLFYLSDVEEGGQTAFPVADNETFTQESLDAVPYDIYDLSANCLKSNVVVPPEKGKAILWYNHHLDDETGWMGDIRNHSLHGGCDVISGTKWIANNWITVDDDARRQVLFHRKFFSTEEDGNDNDHERTADELEKVLPVSESGDSQSGFDGSVDENSLHSKSDSMADDDRTDHEPISDIKDGEPRGMKENVDDVPQQKAQDKLNESDEKPDLYRRTRSGGLEAHTSDEL